MEPGAYPSAPHALKLCGEQPSCRLALHPRAHISAAIAFGYTFPTPSPYDLWVEQKRDEWWRSKLDVKASSPLRIDQTEVAAVQRGTATVEQASAEQANAAALRQLLVTLFNESELRDLCFDMHIDYESLAGQAKGDRARELVAYARRHNRTDELVAHCRRLRPHADWQNVELAIRSDGISDVSVELSIARDDVGNQVQDTIRALGLPIGQRIHLRLPPPHKTVAGAEHAKAIAEQVREVIMQISRHNRRTLHLFAAVPVGLAALIGAHLNACGPIQCYEHRRDQDDYVPACLLRG